MPDWLLRSRFRRAARQPSGWNDTDATSERFGDGQLSLHDLERQRRQGAGRRPVDHRRGFARIVMRIVAGAFENLLVREPAVHLAAGMRTNRGIADDALGGAILG